jgi:hypothetical protein
VNELRRTLGLPVGHAAVRADGHAGGLRAGHHGLRLRLGQAPWANPVLWTVLVLALLLTPPARPTPPTFRARSSSTSCSGRPWWRWPGRCGSAAPSCAARWPCWLAALAGGAAAAAARWPGLGLGLPARCWPRWRPSRSPRRWPWAWPSSWAACRRWRRCLPCSPGLVGAVTGQVPVRRAARAPHGGARLCAGHRLARHRRGARLQVHPDAGAYAALALGLQVLLAALLLPLLAAAGCTGCPEMSRRPHRPSRPPRPSTPPGFPMQTNLAPEFKGTPDGESRRSHPAQVRALRLLHRHLPHLPAAGRRARRPARPHLPDEAGAGRRRGHAQDAAAPGPLPDLPQLRDHLPQRRAVRAPGGHRPPDRRAAVERPRRRARRALAAEGGPDLAAVRPGDEDGPAGAPAAAGGAEGQGAGRPPARAPTAGPRAATRARC